MIRPTWSGHYDLPLLKSSALLAAGIGCVFSFAAAEIVKDQVISALSEATTAKLVYKGGFISPMPAWGMDPAVALVHEATRSGDSSDSRDTTGQSYSTVSKSAVKIEKPGADRPPRKVALKAKARPTKNSPSTPNGVTGLSQGSSQDSASTHSSNDVRFMVQKRDSARALYVATEGVLAAAQWEQASQTSVGFEIPVVSTRHGLHQFGEEITYAWFIQNAYARVPGSEPKSGVAKFNWSSVQIIRPLTVQEPRVVSEKPQVVAQAAPARALPVFDYPSADYPSAPVPMARSEAPVAQDEPKGAQILADVTSVIGYSALSLEEVAGATSQVWSFEGWAKTSSEGWVVSTAQEQWPTLSYLSTQRQGSAVVKPAFLSQREASVLSAIGGVALQPEAGIVFGEVPSGYIVEVSGRSEYPVYWIPGQGAVSSQEFGSTRWFGFTNVEPGMQIVSLINMWTSERVPVAVPVVAGYSSHLDLKEVSRLSIHLKVLDGARVDGSPRSGVRVTRAGVSADTYASDRAGQVNVGNQLVVHPYPIYLELQESSSAGFPQRVRIASAEAMSSRDSPVTLPFLPVKTVNDLVSQLEPSDTGSASIHPTSGMALVAWDGKSHLSRGDELYPVDHPLDPTATLEPEVYFIDSEDRLSVQGSVGRSLSRVMAVQLDPGLHKMVLGNDSDKGESWSELSVISTGVVSLLRTGYQN